MGSWLEGKTLAKKIKEKVKNDVALYLKQEKEVPGLAAILVGENRASKIYLRTKERNCERLGIHSEILVSLCSFLCHPRSMLPR
jgi:methylenetetrahydrofolate dehydrogenase (NADP+)/methenyltetrahydrofolate cyclohydrolase